MTRSAKSHSTIAIKRQVFVGAMLLLVLVVMAACGIITGPEPTQTVVPTEAPATATGAATNTPEPTEEPPTATSAPTEPPEAPSEFDAALTAAEELTLSWVDNSETEAGFIIRRVLANTDDPGIEMGRPVADATSFIDRSIECSAVYQYYISAFNPAGVSEATCVRVTTPAQCDQDGQSVQTEDCDPAPGAVSGAADTPACGNLICDEGESFASCTSDCALVIVCNNNGVCDMGEQPSTCANDCSSCNVNLTCEQGENPITCPTDCALVLSCNNNGVCDAGENVANCTADCLPTGACNFNGACDAGESFASCPSDCVGSILP